MNEFQTKFLDATDGRELFLRDVDGNAVAQRRKGENDWLDSSGEPLRPDSLDESKIYGVYLGEARYPSAYRIKGEYQENTDPSLAERAIAAWKGIQQGAHSLAGGVLGGLPYAITEGEWFAKFMDERDESVRQLESEKSDESRFAEGGKIGALPNASQLTSFAAQGLPSLATGVGSGFAAQALTKGAATASRAMAGVVAAQNAGEAATETYREGGEDYAIGTILAGIGGYLGGRIAGGPLDWKKRIWVSPGREGATEAIEQQFIMGGVAANLEENPYDADRWQQETLASFWGGAALGGVGSAIESGARKITSAARKRRAISQIEQNIADLPPAIQDRFRRVARTILSENITADEISQMSDDDYSSRFGGIGKEQAAEIAKSVNNAKGKPLDNAAEIAKLSPDEFKDAFGKEWTPENAREEIANINSTTDESKPPINPVEQTEQPLAEQLDEQPPQPPAESEALSPEIPPQTPTQSVAGLPTPEQITTPQDKPDTDLGLDEARTNAQLQAEREKKQSAFREEQNAKRKDETRQSQTFWDRITLPLQEKNRAPYSFGDKPTEQRRISELQERLKATTDPADKKQLRDDIKAYKILVAPILEQKDPKEPKQQATPLGKFAQTARDGGKPTIVPDKEITNKKIGIKAGRVSKEGKPIGITKNKNGEAVNIGLVHSFQGLSPRNVAVYTEEFQPRTRFDKKARKDTGGANTINVGEWNLQLGKGILVYVRKNKKTGQGEIIVLDGHNRLELAQSELAGGKEVELQGDIIYEEDGWTNETAAALGTFKNISGQTNPADRAFMATILLQDSEKDQKVKVMVDALKKSIDRNILGYAERMRHIHPTLFKSIHEETIERQENGKSIAPASPKKFAFFADAVKGLDINQQSFVWETTKDEIRATEKTYRAQINTAAAIARKVEQHEDKLGEQGMLKIDGKAFALNSAQAKMVGKLMKDINNTVIGDANQKRQASFAVKALKAFSKQTNKETSLTAEETNAALELGKKGDIIKNALLYFSGRDSSHFFKLSSKIADDLMKNGETKIPENQVKSIQDNLTDALISDIKGLSESELKTLMKGQDPQSLADQEKRDEDQAKSKERSDSAAKIQRQREETAKQKAENEAAETPPKPPSVDQLRAKYRDDAPTFENTALRFLGGDEDRIIYLLGDERARAASAKLPPLEENAAKDKIRELALILGEDEKSSRQHNERYYQMRENAAKDKKTLDDNASLEDIEIQPTIQPKDENQGDMFSSRLPPSENDQANKKLSDAEIIDFLRKEIRKFFGKPPATKTESESPNKYPDKVIVHIDEQKQTPPENKIGEVWKESDSALASLAAYKLSLRYRDQNLPDGIAARIISNAEKSEEIIIAQAREDKETGKFYLEYPSTKAPDSFDSFDSFDSQAEARERIRKMHNEDTKISGPEMISLYNELFNESLSHSPISKELRGDYSKEKTKQTTRSREDDLSLNREFDRIKRLFERGGFDMPIAKVEKIRYYKVHSFSDITEQDATITYLPRPGVFFEGQKEGGKYKITPNGENYLMTLPGGKKEEFDRLSFALSALEGYLSDSTIPEETQTKKPQTQTHIGEIEKITPKIMKDAVRAYERASGQRGLDKTATSKVIRSRATELVDDKFRDELIAKSVAFITEKNPAERAKLKNKVEQFIRQATPESDLPNARNKTILAEMIFTYADGFDLQQKTNRGKFAKDMILALKTGIIIKAVAPKPKTQPTKPAAPTLFAQNIQKQIRAASRNNPKQKSDLQKIDTVLREMGGTAAGIRIQRFEQGGRQNWGAVDITKRVIYLGKAMQKPEIVAHEISHIVYSMLSPRDQRTIRAAIPRVRKMKSPDGFFYGDLIDSSINEAIRVARVGGRKMSADEISDLETNEALAYAVQHSVVKKSNITPIDRIVRILKRFGRWLAKRFGASASFDDIVGAVLGGDILRSQAAAEGLLSPNGLVFGRAGQAAHFQTTRDRAILRVAGMKSRQEIKATEVAGYLNSPKSKRDPQDSDMMMTAKSAFEALGVLGRRQSELIRGAGEWFAANTDRRTDAQMKIKRKMPAKMSFLTRDALDDAVAKSEPPLDPKQRPHLFSAADKKRNVSLPILESLAKRDSVSKKFVETEILRFYPKPKGTGQNDSNELRRKWMRAATEKVFGDKGKMSAKDFANSIADNFGVMELKDRDTAWDTRFFNGGATSRNVFDLAFFHPQKTMQITSNHPIRGSNSIKHNMAYARLERKNDEIFSINLQEDINPKRDLDLIKSDPVEYKEYDSAALNSITEKNKETDMEVLNSTEDESRRSRYRRYASELMRWIDKNNPDDAFMLARGDTIVKIQWGGLYNDQTIPTRKVYEFSDSAGIKSSNVGDFFGYTWRGTPDNIDEGIIVGKSKDRFHWIGSNEFMKVSVSLDLAKSESKKKNPNYAAFAMMLLPGIFRNAPIDVSLDTSPEQLFRDYFKEDGRHRIEFRHKDWNSLEDMEKSGKEVLDKIIRGDAIVINSEKSEMFAKLKEENPKTFFSDGVQDAVRVVPKSVVSDFLINREESLSSLSPPQKSNPIEAKLSSGHRFVYNLYERDYPRAFKEIGAKVEPVNRYGANWWRITKPGAAHEPVIAFSAPRGLMGDKPYWEATNEGTKKLGELEEGVRNIRKIWGEDGWRSEVRAIFPRDYFHNLADSKVVEYDGPGGYHESVPDENQINKITAKIRGKYQELLDYTSEWRSMLDEHYDQLLEEGEHSKSEIRSMKSEEKKAEKYAVQMIKEEMAKIRYANRWFRKQWPSDER